MTVNLDEIDLSHEAAFIAHLWEVVEQRHAFQTLENALKDRLRELMGGASHATVNGEVVASLSRYKRYDFDRGRFRQDHGQLYELYLRPIEVVRVVPPPNRRLSGTVADAQD